jgi:predicted lysophospholipase L1 biosynthesis ABC-type transport system permease subunit
MSCLLLATAGAVFMGGLNLRAAWAQLVEAGAAQRHFQVELSVATPLNPLAMASLVRDTPDVLVTEPWPSQRANWAGSLSRTYPDGGHGQLLLRRVPPQAQLQQPRLLQGRWLAEAVQPDDLVLNTAALSTLEKAANLGDPVALELDGEILRGRLVGVVEEPLSPPTVYAPGSAEGTSRQWRLALRPSADPEATVARLAQQLPAMRATLEADQRRAGSNHLLVLQRALAWVAIGTGVVGLVALASALGSGVAERRRELGVLRSLGASDRLLGAAVVLEAGLVVTLSLGLAVLLGMAIDPLLAARLAAITGQPLETHASAWSVRLWAALAAAGGVLASTLPARAAVQRA